MRFLFLDDDSDRLMSYNGEEFVYDTIGNPTTYRGKTATWAYGRELTEFDGNTFAYDARGRRISKNDITFTYDSNGNLIKQSNGLEFLYDHTGVFAVKYNGSTYFYRKNAQKDIIALLDNNGVAVVKYKYDAWGKCQTIVADSTVNSIATLNPFRYRSYYFDTETNLYFLKTRYYDPEIGRFMTIDDISYLVPKHIISNFFQNMFWIILQSDTNNILDDEKRQYVQGEFVYNESNGNSEKNRRSWQSSNTQGNKKNYENTRGRPVADNIGTVRSLLPYNA